MTEINVLLLGTYLVKKSGNEILDAGCGTGAAFSYLSRFGNVTGVDISDEALKFARTLGRVKKSDIIDMPFSENSFEAVICLDVLYHRWVGDYKKALREFWRVLRPGGILFIREPAYNWMRGSHDKVDFTKHRFNKAEIEHEIIQAGFRIKKITYANFLLFPFVLLKRIPQMLIPTHRAVSDMQSVPPFVDRLLFTILRFEAKLMSWVSLPWGSSLLCVGQKI